MGVAAPKRRKARRWGTGIGLPANCDTFSIMPGMTRRAGLVTAALLGAVVAVGIAQGRQGRGDRQPDAPMPNIREYKPTSTLVVPEHLVPRAKFPAIDFHGHPPPLTTPEAVERVVMPWIR